jgi:LPS-assembly lipoprotein
VLTLFKLRGQQELPFDSIYIPPNNPLLTELSRYIEFGSNAKVVNTPTEAQATIGLLAELQEKVIVALNSKGQVQEYTLRYRVVFRVSSQKGVDFLPATEIVLNRDITFNNQVLAKENEEAQLYRDMRSDMVQQMLRRIAASRPPSADPDE